MSSRQSQFVFNATGQTSSVQFGNRSPTGFYVVTALGSATLALLLERSYDGAEVVDADATFLPVKKEDGTQISFVVTADAPQSIQINPGDYFRLGRVRLTGDDGAGGPTAPTEDTVVEVTSEQM